MQDGSRVGTNNRVPKGEVAENTAEPGRKREPIYFEIVHPRNFDVEELRVRLEADHQEVPGGGQRPGGHRTAAEREQQPSSPKKTQPTGKHQIIFPKSPGRKGVYYLVSARREETGGVGERAVESASAGLGVPGFHSEIAVLAAQ